MSDTLIVIIVLIAYFSPVFYQLAIVLRERKKGNLVPWNRFKKVLKYSLLIIIPVAIGFAIISRTNYFNYESPIRYDEIDRITFKNFRGLEFFKKSLYGNKRFAYVVTTMNSDIENDQVRIEALFHPSKSFVYNTHSNSNELLTHELYHFKITELFVRKAKKRIVDKKLERGEIENLIETIWLEERSFQAKYDFDTFHSYVYGEQKNYERRIDSLLNLLADYKNPKIDFND